MVRFAFVQLVLMLNLNPVEIDDRHEEAEGDGDGHETAFCATMAAQRAHTAPLSVDSQFCQHRRL